jgi:hypothetical protein
VATTIRLYRQGENTVLHSQDVNPGDAFDISEAASDLGAGDFTLEASAQEPGKLEGSRGNTGQFTIDSAASPNLGTVYHSGGGTSPHSLTGVTVATAANRYLVAFVIANTSTYSDPGAITWDGLNITTVGNSGTGTSGLTWTLRARFSGNFTGAGNQWAQVTIWTAPVSSSLSNQSFAMTAPGSPNWGGAHMVVANDIASFGGQNAVAVMSPSGTPNDATIDVTVQATGSLLVAFGYTNNDGTARNVASDQTKVDEYVDSGNANDWWLQRKTDLTTTTGTHTLATTNTVGGNDSWYMGALELKA